ncbi:LPS biosynthesis protein [Vibrio cholerae]|uniref:N-acetyl sugar amidotransferase n=1 Tax=Vibrio cholerae TaxID=666 RepID=UPI00157A274D|nr:N-acetyl sugar amidotransferase [Vibrio cholerae]CAB1259797.1 LPS biosynthesis protein [Vibrio cholerae]
MKINNNTEYAVCSKCVLDTTVNDISFNENGVCNYCLDYEYRVSHIVEEDVFIKQNKLDKLLSNIRSDGKRRHYDCIVGVSGGVDSSWALVQAKKLGLRPLAVHMDNGWNSELAQSNIENLVKKLDVDLYTYVIDWDEYKKLMQAFFDADVIDVELLYDNAMLAINYQLAHKYGIKYILSGCNISTEGVRVPTGWNWFKKDKLNIKSIAASKKIKIKSFPAIGTMDFIYYEFLRGIKWLPFLDYFKFNKEEALNVLESDFSYKRYPFKHYESIFTRLYQGFILPEKFNVDKRRLHFSSLILSGQMLRCDALEKLNCIPYASEEILSDDINYFLKKMGWSEHDLSSYLARPEKSHAEYGSEKKLWDICQSLYFCLVNKK